jgi:Icc-related predicted phosphoesterase
MNLLLFSDLHDDLAAARSLVVRARGADLLVGAGDFCNAHRGLQRCLDVLRGTGKPAVLVAGNHETPDELRDACKGWSGAHVLHGSAVTLSGVTFFGLGGGIPITPFGSWSYDFTEEEGAELLEGCPPGCVLVSHSPPQGAVDVSSRGQSLGSTAVRQALERVRPRLVVCGHIHGSAGQQGRIGATPVVNAGPEGIEHRLGAAPIAVGRAACLSLCKSRRTPAGSHGTYPQPATEPVRATEAPGPSQAQHEKRTVRTGRGARTALYALYAFRRSASAGATLGRR